MTNEQLEIIRAKFEALHPVPEWMEWSEDKENYMLSKTLISSNANEFTYNEYRAMWVGFLSCMSQEIELACSHWLEDVYRKDDVIKSLEAQGYMVKR